MQSKNLIRQYLDILSEKAKSPYTGSEAAKNIQALNPDIKDVNRIQVGQKIRLPGQDQPYVVKKGDTLDSIALRQAAPKSAVIGPERKELNINGTRVTVGSERDYQQWLDSQRPRTEPDKQVSAAPDLSVSPPIPRSDLGTPAAPAGRIQPRASAITSADKDRINAEIDALTGVTATKAIDFVPQYQDVKPEADVLTPRRAGPDRDVERELELADEPVPDDDITGILRDRGAINETTTQDLLRRYIDILKEAETSQVAEPERPLSRRVTVNPDGTFQPAQPDAQAWKQRIAQDIERQQQQAPRPPMPEEEYQRRLAQYKIGGRGAGFGFQPRPEDAASAEQARAKIFGKQ